MMSKIKPFFRSLRSLIKIVYEINNELKLIRKKIETINDVLIEDHLQRRLNFDSTIQNELNHFEFKSYSQNGEDGLIKEIFERIGTTNKFFVEFGVQDGLETNSTLLILKGWNGVWIEADQEFYSKIQKNFEKELTAGFLKVTNAFVNSENIETLLEESKVPFDFDLLSIDIDSNDYWVWKAINKFRPRVVIIEYNAFFPPDVEWVMKYDPNKMWDSSIVFGASIKSLTKLAESKGYTLVASSYAGVNAFFVRNDLVQENFKVMKIEDIYHPIRYKINRDLSIKKRFPSSI